MKLRSMVMACAATVALCGVALASDATGWYVGFGGGYDILQKQSVGLFGTKTADIKVKFDGAAAIVGSAGYRFTDHIRLEGELGYTIHHADYGYSKTLAVRGHEVFSSLIVNALYDYALTPKWGLTFGAGLGFNAINARLYNTYDTSTFKGSSDGAVVQGIAGVTYSLNDHTDLGIDYRYRYHFGQSSFGGDTLAISDGYNRAGIKGISEHLFLFNVRYFLSSPPPPPPPVMAPPPPPPVMAPPPPPPVTTYIVFFDFNKSNLDPKAQEVVAQAVKTANANGFVKVVVTGHTDTVGSDKYNLTLSVARAQSVKDEMVRLGLGTDGIAIQGKGFHDPLVSTDKNVREPQNRRAVIDLGK
jgi:OmpA-OmpF porin, OOP family